MRAWIDNVTVDAADPEVLAAFYAALLDRDVVPGKARIHVDLRVDDLAEATARAVEFGAAPRHADVAEHGLAWRVMSDPEDNPFCLTEERW